MLDRSDSQPVLAAKPFGLGVALAGTPSVSRGTRAALDWVAEQGLPIVQLDASQPDCRPRELDVSARRDLAASIRRRGMACCGLDLWIPPKHFVSGPHADRAVAATLGAIELAAELAQRAGTGSPGVVSVHLADAAIRRDLMQHAQSHGVVLADNAWPIADRTGDGPPDVGIDPASVLMGGGEPDAAVLAAGRRLGSVRLSDCAAEGRVAVGDGRLDRLALLAALDASGFAGTAIIDVRGVSDAEHAVASAIDMIATAF